VITNGNDDAPAAAAADVCSGSSDDSDDSDDSIVGEHSPFVKHVGRKRYLRLWFFIVTIISADCYYSMLGEKYTFISGY
jgi:hypothetical protein